LLTSNCRFRPGRPIRRRPSALRSDRAGSTSWRSARNLTPPLNAATQKQAGDILPVVITVFKDKSFTFITKSPPAAILLKKAANIAAGSKEPNKTKVGKVTRKQIMDIVKTKAKDLNSRNDEAGFKIIAGTARQMGLEVVD